MMSRRYSTIPEGTVKPDNPTGNPDMLESRIMQVASWGRILQVIAGSSGKIDADDLFVIGYALDSLGGHLHDDAEAFAAKHGGAL